MKALLKENYNLNGLAEIWADYVDWEKRRKNENGFLLQALKKHKASRIINLALGDGCDSIYLAKEGFDLTNNEFDKAFLDVALQNIRKAGLDMPFHSLEWRELNREVMPESFDAALCLGNSLTYLFTTQAQLKALKEFRNLLKENGILMIDERNYQYLLDNREKVTREPYESTGNYMYCGSKVTGKLKDIYDNKITFEFYRDGKATGFLMKVYPFKRGELKNLLKQVGFSKIVHYSDYKLGENEKASFYQYVCVK